jgi:hypothetical protein
MKAERKSTAARIGNFAGRAKTIFHVKNLLKMVRLERLICVAQYNKPDLGYE